MRTSLAPASTAGLPGLIMPVSGMWVLATPGAANLSASVPVLGTPESQAFALAKPATITGIGWHNNSIGAATNFWRFFLYDNDPLYTRPRNMIKDAGTYTNGTSAGPKGLTFTNFPVPAGIYWVVFVLQGSGTIPSLGNSAGPSPFIPNDGVSFVTDNGRYTHASVPSGSPPSPMDAPSGYGANMRRIYIFFA